MDGRKNGQAGSTLRTVLFFNSFTLSTNSITEMNTVKKLIHPFFSSLLAVFFGTLSFCDRLNLDLDQILVNRSSPWLEKVNSSDYDLEDGPVNIPLLKDKVI